MKTTDIILEAESFKRYVLNGYDIDELSIYLQQMAARLELIDASELASLIGSTVGSLYCPHDALCERYGFSGEADMLEDIREIAEETGADQQAVNDALHSMAEHPYQNISGGFYGSDEIIFVDLSELRSCFA